MFVFDFEVFSHDWLVVFKNIKNDEYTTIINDTEKLKKFYEENKNNIFFGYNNRFFDDIIFKAILSGADPYGVMLMLFEKEPKYKIEKMFGIKRYRFITFDLMQDILGMSLKEAEGYMGLSIDESTVSFNLMRPLSENEIEETITYCKHDVDATHEVLKYRMPYVKNKMELLKYFSLPLYMLNYTGATLGSIILDANPVSYDDEMEYTLPEEVDIRKYKKTVEFYTWNPLDYSKTLKMDIANVPHVLAYGGIHGAINNFEYQGEMWEIDAASYYPTLMIEYNYVTRSIDDFSKYKDIYKRRLEYKKTNKALSNALKLVLNSAYGATKDKNNNMYDPKIANAVCITGQLLLVDLIEKIEDYCTLVQSNTDGILIIPHDKERIQEEIDKWSKRTRIILETNIISGIWQKDVNNYIVRFDNGKLKTKGAYVSQYPPVGDFSRGNNVLRNTSRICDLAVVDYFVKGVPVEETILNHKEIRDFQIITKTGATFTDTVWAHKDGEKIVNNVNRVYATKHRGYGSVYKRKIDEHGNVYSRSLIANLPANCYVDNEATMKMEYIDVDYYIRVAHKRIRDFKGGNV